MTFQMEYSKYTKVMLYHGPRDSDNVPREIDHDENGDAVFEPIYYEEDAGQFGSIRTPYSSLAFIGAETHRRLSAARSR
jgi:hypothetical protein